MSTTRTRTADLVYLALCVASAAIGLAAVLACPGPVGLAYCIACCGGGCCWASMIGQDE